MFVLIKNAELKAHRNLLIACCNKKNNLNLIYGHGLNIFCLIDLEMDICQYLI